MASPLNPPDLIKSCESSSSELSKQIESELSESVVSLASFVGDTMLFECTGIIIENCVDDTSVLTSASIVGSSDYEITDNLMIKVRLPSDRVVIGWLHHCNFKYDLAVVNIRRARGFKEAHLSSSHHVQFESNSKVVAVGRCFDSGMLKSTNGTVIGSASDELCEITLPTYKINNAWIGCPLVDFDGNFVGMNLRCGGRTAFVPWNTILECLRHSGKVRVGINQGGDDTKEVSTAKSQKAGLHTCFMQLLRECARDAGYVPPGIPCDDNSGRHVIYSFDQEFEGNIWSTLSKDVASTMSKCVVSLASFDGDVRRFACTGICINCNPTMILTSASLVRISDDGNKIDDNLRIQVYLDNKQHVIGTLKHCDLRYNVAVVEIMGSCSLRAMELEKRISFTPNGEVIAVGCLFEHQKLMASGGMLINGKSPLPCKELRISTCKITKAGIGGPLIDTSGNFIGMNFFHDEETPYLQREKIQEILGYSDEQWRCAAETNDNDGSNSWRVPKPFYFFPAFSLDDDLSVSDEENVFTPPVMMGKTNYVHGAQVQNF